MRTLAVAIGGMLGALARYYVSFAMTHMLGKSFPVATLVVNGFGSLIIGILFVLSSKMHPHVFLLFSVGFCGAFTTFSTFALDTIMLARTGFHFRVMLFVALNLAVSFGAVLLGIACGKGFLKG